MIRDMSFNISDLFKTDSYKEFVITAIEQGGFYLDDTYIGIKLGRPYTEYVEFEGIIYTLITP